MAKGQPPAFMYGHQTALGCDGRLYQKRGKTIIRVVCSWLLWRSAADMGWILQPRQKTDHEMMEMLLQHLADFNEDGDMDRLKSRVTGDSGDLLSSECSCVLGGIQYYDIYKMYMTLRIIAFYFGRENALKLLRLDAWDAATIDSTDVLVRTSKYLIQERALAADDSKKDATDSILTSRELWTQYMLAGWAGTDLWHILHIMQSIVYAKLDTKVSVTSVRDILYNPATIGQTDSLNIMVRNISSSYGITLFMLWKHGIFDEAQDTFNHIIHA